MSPNPYLHHLGFSADDRVVIVHVDDVGMCHASLQAFADLWDAGTITSGAVMTPCPWFPATAAWARAHPEVDLGVHATLNAEWDGYRWGPVSTRDRATGLLDAGGYFHARETAVWEAADPDAARVEIEAQVEQALVAGIDVTHIDTHMGTITHPRFIQGYLQTLLRYHRPGLIPRLSKEQFLAYGIAPDEASAETFAATVGALEASGVPLIDAIDYLPLDDPADQLNLAKRKLAALPSGISHFLMHPAVDTPELRAIAPDWPSRVANYEAFISPDMRAFLRDAGLHLIGYRQLREAWREQGLGARD
jgi:predicted glycoside hydrolase/deacetylase ChbG (UPF0249 family)